MMTLKTAFLYSTIFFYAINAEIRFHIFFNNIDLISKNNPEFRLSASYGKTTAKSNIYEYTFYLQERVRINTTFSMGSTYAVIYLNYPSTFTNINTVANNSMKDLNGAGIIILSPQPANTTAENLPNQKNIKPLAYFTLGDIPIGWQLYCPSDYYEEITPNSKEVIHINTYNENLYMGRNSGPVHTKSDFNKDLVSLYIKGLGKGNIAFGNTVGNFHDLPLISYNNIFGYFSGGKLITGSFNQTFGSYNLCGKEINPNILSQDYYANNDFLNYNNIMGFGNMNVTHPITISHLGKKIANKQNNIIGNLNFHSIWFGMRNCVLGNRNFIADENKLQFSYVDSNLVIGNDIAWLQDNTVTLANVWKNIWIIPSGTYDSGGINMQPALTNDMIESIMIGSCGGSNTYNRSYSTFIANIFDVPLVDAPDHAQTKKQLYFGLGNESIPQAVFISRNDQLGSPGVQSYGSDYTSGMNEPGNVYNIDSIVLDELLNLPIIGIAFENSTAASENGLIYTVDIKQIINNPETAIHRLSSFITFHAKKTFLQKPLIHKEKIKKEVYAAPTPSGYEHYYLIPLLVRAIQLIFNQFNTFKKKQNELLQEIIEQNNLLLVFLSKERSDHSIELNEILTKNSICLNKLHESIK